MANKEQLAILRRRGVKAWNVWCQGHRGVRVDLTGADLTRAKLVGVDLSWARLKGARLNGADLAGADLSWANLERALLVSTHLANANLTGCYVYGLSAWDLVVCLLSSLQF
jgi:uncharacterized protein YjbI with pentapeptide repeats